MRDGEIESVEPSAFDLLELLLRNADRVVSNDEIHEAIRAGTYVSETDNYRVRPHPDTFLHVFE